MLYLKGNFNIGLNLLKNMLQDCGYFVIDFFAMFALEEIAQVKNEVSTQNWMALDQRVQRWNQRDGVLFKFLTQFTNFSTMEHIIAIRQSPDDEDGIWHDDGSRVLAYSLSFNLNPNEITGGELLFRKKNCEHLEKISPLPFGQMVVFLTGTSGYEHKVCAVTTGQRIISAGWCE
jgi:hypothetical protein